MHRLLIVVFLIPFTMHAQSYKAPGQPVSAFGFLLGKWVSVPGPGEAGRGSSEFTAEAQGSVVIRKNHAEYPASPRGPAGTHDDMMMVVRGGSPDSLRAVYADNEGHVIHYIISSPRQDELVFISQPAEGSPRYRLWYGAVSADTVAGSFEIAPPATPDAFTRYLEWRMVRSVTPQ